MLATTMSGLDGMLQEPNGCFEQASSTNYPNVMIMQYMEQHDVADAALAGAHEQAARQGLPEARRLRVPKKGYEWFGGDPGHEALTAYGLMQFPDMKKVFARSTTRCSRAPPIG